MGRDTFDPDRSAHPPPRSQTFTRDASSSSSSSNASSCLDLFVRFFQRSARDAIAGNNVFYLSPQAQAGIYHAVDAVQLRSTVRSVLSPSVVAVINE